MPTGYTAYIEDGSIDNGKDFLKLCSRAFGVAVDIKDEPLSVPTPTKFEESPYYKEYFVKSLKKLCEFLELSDDEIANKRYEEYLKSIEYYKKCIENHTALNEKYKKIRGEVGAWTPPTDAHRNIKNFAFEQIDMCMPSEDIIEACRQKLETPFDDSKDTNELYKKDRIESLWWDVKRAYNSWKDEIKRTEEKNDFMRLFLESFENEDS